MNNGESNNTNIPTPQPVPQGDGKNGLGVAGFVLGLIGTVLCWIWYLGLPCGIIGLILSIKGRKDPDKKGLSTAGLVLGIIAVCLSGIITICVICTLGAAGLIEASSYNAIFNS